MPALRILALHGLGTSARIWEAQSQSFRSLLPAEWSFEFVDGEQLCHPADGIADVYPGPYLRFYDAPTQESIETAMAGVHEILDEDGPFDAVMGFSQGAALAASLIMHHQDHEPFAAPLFRFAIFVNGGVPPYKPHQMGRDGRPRIDIPTAHLYGKSDPFRPYSLHLLELCDATQVLAFEHIGGHDVPRAPDQSREMAKTIMRTFERAHFVSA